jgi:hypothetical protein
MQTNKKSKTPWPTKAAMEQIYEKHLWGGSESKFYSGEGSHLDQLVQPYIKVVKEFLTSFEQPITVCDLGCGDFNVGKKLVKYTKNYIGVDIVERLIEYNKEKYKAENLEFQCLDIAADDLPVADCVMIRQVLQHLSNQEVQNILQKLSAYQYVIVTEHIPEGEFVPNIDIISGQGIRLKKRSGINLLKSPFNLNIKEEKKLIKDKSIIIIHFYLPYAT